MEITHLFYMSFGHVLKKFTCPKSFQPFRPEKACQKCDLFFNFLKITVEIDFYKNVLTDFVANPAYFDRRTIFVGPVVPKICQHLLLCLFGHLSIGKPWLFFTWPTQILPVPDSRTVYNFHPCCSFDGVLSDKGTSDNGQTKDFLSRI